MRNLKLKEMSAHEKASLWNSIEQNLGTQYKPFSYLLFWSKFQSRIIATSVAILLLLGGAVTASAHSARPGDLLFPLAVAGEKAQILFASNTQAKESLHIKFAERRLSEIKNLKRAAGLVAGTSTVAVTSATTTNTEKAAIKLARAAHGVDVALAELIKTRNALVANGSTDAVLIIDDIILELRGVGGGNVLITRLTSSNEKDGKTDIKIHATFTSTSTATSTFTGVVKIDEKKNGAKLELKSGGVKTKISLSENKQKGDNEKSRKDNDREEDEDDGDEDDDKDDGKDDDEKGDKKISICHKQGAEEQSLSVSRNAARAHMAHGDKLGRCRENTPHTPDTRAPIISLFNITPEYSSAIARWQTNENATALIWLSTSTPVDTNIMPTITRSTMQQSHQISITGLDSSTTYHVVVASKDASGNSATSSERSFRVE